MNTSHKLTHLVFASLLLLVLTGAGLAQQVNSTGAPIGALSQPEATNSAVALPAQNPGMGMYPSPQPPGYRGNWNNENGTSALQTNPGVNNGGRLRSIGQVANPADPPAQVGDQKLGSLLVYPYYTSNAATGANTWLSIGNISNGSVLVHLFFIEGISCNQADMFVCLTANARLQMKASEFDPETTKGWVLAVAVGADGKPLQKNVLAGNAFVNNGSSLQGSYSAESFGAYNNAPTTANIAPNAAVNLPAHAAALAADPMCQVKLENAVTIPGQVDYISFHGYNANNYIPGLYDDLGNGTVTLNFTGPPTFCSATDTNKEPFGVVLTDPALHMITRTFQLNGGGYDFVPNRFAVEIQSPEDAPGQMIITVGLNGDLSQSDSSGGAQVGTGTIVNGNETPFGSFVNFITGKCQSMGTVDNNNPRVPRGVNGLIPRGQVGTLQFGITAGVGVLLTPRNNKGTQGIQRLHKTNLNIAAVSGGDQDVIVQNVANPGAPTVVRRTAVRRYGVGLTIPVYIPPGCPTAQPVL